MYLPTEDCSNNGASGVETDNKSIHENIATGLRPSRVEDNRALRSLILSAKSVLKYRQQYPLPQAGIRDTADFEINDLIRLARLSHLDF